jgi:hypothetical protein
VRPKLAALETAVAEGKLVRNLARLVKPPKHEQREKSTWSPEQVREFPSRGRTLGQPNPHR